MPTTTRRHPRVALERTAVVEVRAPSAQMSLGGRPNVSKITVSVVLQDVSLGGMALRAPNTAIERGVNVRVSVQVGVKTLSVPALVVWSRSPTEEGGGIQAGLKMQLEVTDLATRKSFEAWINELERAQVARAAPQPPRKLDEKEAGAAAKLFDELFRK